MPALAQAARVLAVDMRGHGESDKPDHGYKIARLATDLHDMLTALDLEDVVLLGHSMGSSIAWCYHELFGYGRVSGLVVVDQAPCAIAKPGWTAQQIRDYGVLFPTPEGAYQLYATLTSPTAEADTPAFLRRMFTAGFDPATFDFIVGQNLKMPRQYAADLQFNHLHNDWRDAIGRIRVPTLVVGGTVSIFTAESQRWIAAQIPGATADIYEEADGGGHFMFIENPQRFNASVVKFLAG
ncbi:MAG: alpha/beta hydrolase [Alphaproteobacteria bacterium]